MPLTASDFYCRLTLKVAKIFQTFPKMAKSCHKLQLAAIISQKFDTSTFCNFRQIHFQFWTNIDWLLLTDFYWLTSTDWLLLTDFFWLTSTDWLLLTDFYWLISTDWLLLTDFYWLTSTDWLLLTDFYWITSLHSLMTLYWLYWQLGTFKAISWIGLDHRPLLLLHRASLIERC